jgi:hypothetical protein
MWSTRPLRALSRRRKAAALFAVVSAGAFAAVGIAQIGSASPRVDVRTLALRQAAGPIKGLFVAAGRVRGDRSEALADTAESPLSGWIAPVAVPTPDGSHLVYSTWRELRHENPALSWSKQGVKPGDALGTPTLRIHDFGSGRDTVIDTNSFSAAVRGDGAIAYVRGSDVYRAFANYTGDLVVRSSASGRPVVWSTEPAYYVAAAWAGNTLLAYRIREGEKLDVLALDGPGQQRLLMAGASLVAVSPDGTQAFLASDDADAPASVAVVNVGNGSVARSLDLGSLNEGILWAAYGGSWSGDLVAAPTNTGIAVFDLSGGAISLKELLKPSPGTFANGIIEPQFSGDAEHVIARGDTPPGKDAPAGDGSTTPLDCDLATVSCAVGTTEPGRDWLHPAYNPSRPLKGAAS